MSVLRSIRNTLPHANRGKSPGDRLKIFLVIAFETTSFANAARRARIKRLLGRLSQRGLLTIRFARDGDDFTFKLRSDEDGDISVASEFIRGGYVFPSQRPAQIIDGGANIGLFAVLASRRYPDVRIACYEANPHNIEALARNLAANGTNAEVLNKALWSGEGELVFHQHMAYSGHVAPAEGDDGDVLSVPAILPDVGEDCWMKVDIEGAEYEVLPALMRAGRFPRWISAELHYYLEKGSALIALLEAHGYEISYDTHGPDADMIAVFAERKTA